MSEQRVAKKASRAGGWITRSLLLILLLCLGALAAAGYYYGLPLANQLADERDSIKASVAELEARREAPRKGFRLRSTAAANGVG